MLTVRNVAVGVSGGVDSAVAALLLKKKGFNVLGVFMKNWDLVDETGNCTLASDLEDAKFVCERLKIPFHEVDFVKEYWNEVFVKFTRDYEAGLTPNPDILCNRYIKFKAFFNHATKNLNADAIATGHYARTSFGDFLENYREDANARLLRARDEVKDQTFFLSRVPQEALRRTMFPLSSLTKDVTKKIASENGLEKIARKPESTGICFIGYRNFQKFISEYLNPKPGNFIDLISKEVVGKHEGIHMWTVGQRCRIEGKALPFYIVKKFPETGDILVAPGNNHSAHYSCTFFADEPYWLGEPPDLSYVHEVMFRFQHGKPLSECTLFELRDRSLFVAIKKPLRALTPGQYSVFYKGNECLGSARITQAGPSEYSLGNKIPEQYEEYDENQARAASNQG